MTFFQKQIWQPRKTLIVAAKGVMGPSSLVIARRPAATDNTFFWVARFMAFCAGRFFEIFYCRYFCEENNCEESWVRCKRKSITIYNQGGSIRMTYLQRWELNMNDSVRKYYNRSDYLTGSRSNNNNIITKNTYKWNNINPLLKNRQLKKGLLSWILVQVFLILWHPILALGFAAPFCISFFFSNVETMIETRDRLILQLHTLLLNSLPFKPLPEFA